MKGDPQRAMGLSQYTRLSNILDALPDNGLVDALTAPTGRPGHGALILWRAYVACFVLNSSTISAGLRQIGDDPLLSEVVGGAPSKFALSRFIRKLKDHTDLLDACMASLVSGVREFLPDLGEQVAVDSTDIKAWSSWRRSDPDAQSSVKTGTDGRPHWWYGFKAHVACDTRHEIPLHGFVTPANKSDVQQLPPSIEGVRAMGLNPTHVLADAGYDSAANIAYVEEIDAIPIIKRRKLKGRVLPEPTKAWWVLYRKRSGVERIFGRAKEHRRLNRLTLKGLAKATVHCLTAMLTLLAHALATLLLGLPEQVRACV